MNKLAISLQISKATHKKYEPISDLELQGKYMEYLSIRVEGTASL